MMTDLSGVEPHLMVIDPPYGVNYNPAWPNEAGRSVNGRTVRLSSGKTARPLGARAVGKVENDDRADWSEAWVLSPDSSLRLARRDQSRDRAGQPRGLRL
jgi:hypothetical protein